MWVIPYLNALSTTNLTRSRNSTLLSAPPETYWGQFEEISKYNTHLNVAERLWTAWYAWMQNDVLATGIMSFMMHEIVYFGRSLPWIFIDSLGLLKNYKIQSVSGGIWNIEIFFSNSCRTKYPRYKSNGTVPDLCFSAISQSNCLKFGRYALFFGVDCS